jgi:hypothetical protein
MARSMVVFGTSHALQGAQNYPGVSVNAASYSKLIEQLISRQTIDFIFEEASGKGPTIVSKLAGHIPYLDVDASPGNPSEPAFTAKTGSVAIPIDPDDPDLSNDFYVWEYVREQAQRENL